MKHLLKIAAALLLWAPSAPALTQVPAQAAPKYSIELTRPEPGVVLKYYSWDIAVAVTVAAPPGDYEVELSYMGTTHYLPALASEGGTVKNGIQRWSLRDTWLRFELGEHPLQLRLLSLAGTDSGLGSAGRLLAEADTKVTYSYREDEPPAEQARELMRDLAESAIWQAKYLDPVEHYYPDYGDKALGEERGLARVWIRARHSWFYVRTRNLVRIAELYEHSGRPGDGLIALRRAEAIWKAEGGVILHREPATPIPIKWRHDEHVGIPPYLLTYAGFYGRRLETEKAIDYLKEGITFMDEQRRKHPTLDADGRRSCENITGGIMRKIAVLHYLVRRDRAGYELWKKRSKQALARSREKTREGGLLGR